MNGRDIAAISNLLNAASPSNLAFGCDFGERGEDYTSVSMAIMTPDGKIAGAVQFIQQELDDAIDPAAIVESRLLELINNGKDADGAR